MADDLSISAADAARDGGLQIPVQPDAIRGGREAARLRRDRQTMARRAADIADAVRVREIHAGALAYDPDGRLFVNVNTPHDYARARNVAMSEPPQDRITEEQ